MCLSLQPDHSMLVSEPIVEERSARLEYRLDTRKMDPQKAKQAERLGMGVATRRYLFVGTLSNPFTSIFSSNIYTLVFNVCESM